MLQDYSRYKILQEFFDFPRKNFQMREISRRVNLAQPSVINHLKFLAKEEFILKEKKGIYPSFSANRDDFMFRVYRKSNIFIRLYQTGLLDYIYDSCFPRAIILFGSASKGEDTEESDLDIFVQSKEKKLDMKKFEKMLNRKISLLFEDDFSKLGNELKNNILNGIILKGYIKVF